MRSAVLCGDSPAIRAELPFVKTLEIEGMPLSCGLIDTPQPLYDLTAPMNRHKAVVHVAAFSCNYRDKALLLRASQFCHGQSTYLHIGSEFVGTVIAVGPEVTTVQVGDRVIGDNNFPKMSTPDTQPGIPSEHCSQRNLLLHEAKLIKVPPESEMPDEVAAAFSLNAQTAYGMVRRLHITPGSHVLVTAARSNTSLFVFNALKNHSCHVYAMTTSPYFEGDTKQLGIQELIHIDPHVPSFLEHPQVAQLFADTTGFDYVIDPFFDLHLGKALEVMALESRYISCGLYDQYSRITGKEIPYEGKSLHEIMISAFTHNREILGNCLGRTADLQQAINDYTQGTFHVVIDTVCRGEQIETFLERTYIANDRFGKVVYCYDD